jgi:hypothetical protein
MNALARKKNWIIVIASAGLNKFTHRVDHTGEKFSLVPKYVSPANNMVVDFKARK